MPLPLTVYSDYICPFCYLHGEVLRELEIPEDLDVRWVPVEIHPETPVDGRPLKFEGVYAAKWNAYIATYSEEHGIPIDFPAFLPNTAQAMLATAHADARGVGRAFHDRTLAAYWREGRNIGDPAVLCDIAAESGLPGSDPRMWQTPESQAAVAANRTAAMDDMATGFPTTMLGRFPLQGLQTPADLRMHLQRYRDLRAKQAATPTA